MLCSNTCPSHCRRRGEGYRGEGQGREWQTRGEGIQLGRSCYRHHRPEDTVIHSRRGSRGGCARSPLGRCFTIRNALFNSIQVPVPSLGAHLWEKSCIRRCILSVPSVQEVPPLVLYHQFPPGSLGATDCATRTRHQLTPSPPPPPTPEIPPQITRPPLLWRRGHCLTELVQPDASTDLLVLAERRQIPQQQDLLCGGRHRVHLEGADQLRPELGPGGVAVLGGQLRPGTGGGEAAGGAAPPGREEEAAGAPAASPAAAAAAAACWKGDRRVR